MKKKTKQNKNGSDERFDAQLPPLDVPAWVAAIIEHRTQFQANSKASIVRQLLVEGIEARKRRMAS